jgi:hypothetical protein
MVIKHITKAIRKAKAKIAFEHLVMAEDAVTMGVGVDECSEEFQEFFAKYLELTKGKDTS